MTGSNGQFTSLNPAPDPTKCTGAYTGGAVGMPLCGLILAINPMDAQLQPNKAYNMIDLGCVIQCSTGNMCPAGTSAMTAGSQCFCFPN